MLLIFGSPPNNKAPAYSFIARTFFEKLSEATEINGCIRLPDIKNVFKSWIPNGDGEIIIKIQRPLHLFGPEPEEETKGEEPVFDYSRMSGHFFQPDDKLCIIVGNVKYDQLRKQEGFSGPEYEDCL